MTTVHVNDVGEIRVIPGVHNVMLTAVILANLEQLYDIPIINVRAPLKVIIL